MPQQCKLYKLRKQEIGKNQLDILGREYLMSGTFQIRQNYPAPVGFLPEPDFCRIWKSAGFRLKPEPKSSTTLVEIPVLITSSQWHYVKCAQVTV